jgi:ligand-binding SRPBCC domain-containing protein
MNILIKTPINSDFKIVFSKFNLELFTALKPPLVSLKVKRFDGCKKGDEVHLVVNGKLWVSHITELYESEDEIYFVDIGVIIPAPLKSWKHIHRVERTGDKTCAVIDDINYSTGFKMLDLLIYPALKFMFLLRCPVYKRELS